METAEKTKSRPKVAIDWQRVGELERTAAVDWSHQDRELMKAAWRVGRPSGWNLELRPGSEVEVYKTKCVVESVSKNRLVLVVAGYEKRYRRKKNEIAND
jgi:hypothetical protein